MSVSPTLVVGLDGATFDVIDPMVREGKLPNIARLLEAGKKATLLSSNPPLSPIAWTSITTGVNPGKHAIYDFAHRARRSYDFIPYTSRDKRSPAVWDLLGQEGKKVCVVNVPLTYPAGKVNGVMLSGFPSPAQSSDWTYPIGLAGELERELGECEFQKPASLVGEGEEARLLDDLIRKTRNQVKVLSYLLKRERFDFVMTVFDGIDAASHPLWKYMDESHPKYNKTHAAEGRRALYGSYEIADEAIGDLLDLFDSQPNLVLLSDHGNGPVYYGVYINNWLVERKYMALKKGIKTRSKLWAFRRGWNMYNFFRIANKLGLLPGMEAAYGKRSIALDLVKRTSLSFMDVDWSKTRVYSFGNYGQLYVNLKGREPQGIVEPGEEYDDLVRDVVQNLGQLKDPKRGNVMFDQILTNQELYKGPDSIDGPDVLFLDSKMLYDAHRFFEFASNSLVTAHPVYSGNHKREGILVCSGPDFKGQGGLPNPSILDITPTILALENLEVPSYMDGRVLEELIGSTRAGASLAVELESLERRHEPEVYTEAENEALTERLRDLGYV